MRSLLYGLLLASGVVAAQDVYKCVDDQGQTTYTQGACPTNSQITTIPLQRLPDSNGFTPPPKPATPPPATAPREITVVPAPASSRQRPVDDVTVVGSSSSSASFRQETQVRSGGILYQPVPIYIDRRPRDETWHMVPHPQAQPPAPPTQQIYGIPFKR